MSCSRLGTSHSKPGMPHCQQGISRFQLATPHCQAGMPHSQLRTPHCQQETPRCQRGMPHCQRGMGRSLPPLFCGRKEKGGSRSRRARSEIGNAHPAWERLPGLMGMRRWGCKSYFFPSNLSYSAWVPIQNQTMPSAFGESTPKALKPIPARTDQKRPAFFRCREGWFGFFLRMSKFLSATACA